MTTYVYETIPRKPGEKPKRYEFKQNMNDAPLERHPETGEPLRRVMLGGFGVIAGGRRQEAPPPRGPCCRGSERCRDSNRDCGPHCCRH